MLIHNEGKFVFFSFIAADIVLLYCNFVLLLSNHCHIFALQLSSFLNTGQCYVIYVKLCREMLSE